MWQGHLDEVTGEGQVGATHHRMPHEKAHGRGPHGGADGCITWKPYAMITDLPLAELKGIQAKAYAEVAKGIFNKMAL